MKTSTRKTLDTQNPSHVIDFGDYEIRLYDKDTYEGCQKLAVCFNYPDFYEYKTAGGGYCKTSAALEQVFRHIGKKPKGFNGGSSDIPHQYHKGGNYYSVPKSAMRVCK